MTTIAQHAAALDRLVASIDRLREQGAVQDAASAAQVVAAFAAHNHTGRFADPRLEAPLLEAAATLGPFPAWDPARAADPRRVLHVCSSAPPRGGHTRLAWRTVSLDAGRVHDLVVTLAPDGLDPELLAAVAASGGTVHRLPDPAAGLLARARALRELAAQADAVVCFLDPHDVLPVVAFADPDGVAGARPPVLGYDVTDHTLQVHRPAFDRRLVNRAFAHQVAVARRGDAEERVGLLPLAVTGAPSADRAAAKRALGLDPAMTLVITVGAAYKYETEGTHLLDIVEPVLAARPGVALLAAGPADEGRWAAARARLGRVQAVGNVPLDRVWAAADVFLEPYPCGGSTAALEAVAHGVAVVGYAPDPDEADLLHTGASRAGAWPVATSPAEHAALLGRVLDDAAHRAQVVADARAWTALSHDHDAWRAALASHYAAAAAAGPRDRASLLDAPVAVDGGPDRVLHQLHTRGGKELALALVARLEALLACAADPALRPRFVAGLVDPLGWPKVALPAADARAEVSAETASEAVAWLRDLHLAGLARTITAVVAREDLHDVVPHVEAALAAGPDVPLDLVAVEDVAATVAAGELALTTV